MAIITARGHEIKAVSIIDSFDRRALQYKNNIIKTLSLIGVKVDDVDVPLMPGLKRGTAYCSWFFDGRHMHYSYSHQRKFVENLFIVSKVLELEVEAVMSGVKTPEQFEEDFKEDTDIVEKRKEARAFLGVEEGSTDMAAIDKAYKDLAKEHHPDKEGGDTTKFKAINHAHKVLKRELS